MFPDVPADFPDRRDFLADVLEHDYVANQVQPVERTFDTEQDELKAHVLSWSAWSDMYDFVAAPDPTFTQTELGADVLSAIDPDFFMVIRPNGELLFSRFLGGLAGEATLPVAIPAYLTLGNPTLQYASVHDVHTETTVLAGRPVLIASAPIVTGEYKGPIRGSLVIGRFLDGQRLTELRRSYGFDGRSLSCG